MDVSAADLIMVAGPSDVGKSTVPSHRRASTVTTSPQVAQVGRAQQAQPQAASTKITD